VSDRSLPTEVTALGCAETVFWSGAGVSAGAPTCAPLGRELTDRSLTYGFEPQTASIIARHYRALRLRRSSPRLETVLDVVFRVHGPSALVDLLSDVRDASPNGVHRFLASSATGGAGMITTNFDNCLEQAGAQSVLHVHGGFAEDSTGATFGATLAQVERGLPPTMRDALDDFFTSPARKLFVFAGYSGSDFFDVDPYLKRQPLGALDRTAVLWIDHVDPGRGRGSTELSSGRQACAAQRQLAWLQAAGASVYLLRAATPVVLGELGSNWGIGAALDSGSPLDKHSKATLPWEPKSNPASAARRKATLELFLLMGLHAEVDRMLQTTPPIDQAEWNALAHTRWSQGRSREALEAWRQALQGPALAEREAAVDWIRGRYLRARRKAVRAIKQADRTIGSENETPLEQRLVLVETLARIWQHTRRFPDSRLIATDRLRRFALAHLPDPAELARSQSPLGTHLVSRIRSARAALGTSSEEPWDAVESFDEYEALSASLNYQHGQLREDAERAKVPAERYRLLYGDRITIGDTSAATRVMLLPGAHEVFSRREVVAGLRRVDMASWHRLRFLSADAWRRIRRPFF
jgi:hypothetical protein